MSAFPGGQRPVQRLREHGPQRGRRNFVILKTFLLLLKDACRQPREASVLESMKTILRTFISLFLTALILILPLFGS